MLEAEVGVEPRSLGSLNELLQVVMSLYPLQRDVILALFGDSNLVDNFLSVKKNLILISCDTVAQRSGSKFSLSPCWF